MKKKIKPSYKSYTVKIEVSTIEKMAHLARLTLDPKEIPQLMADMEQILTWMEKLNELDTSHVKPLTHMSAEINAFREDQVGKQMDRVKALQNAPETDSSFFLVPKVIDIE